MAHVSKHTRLLSLYLGFSATALMFVVVQTGVLPAQLRLEFQVSMPVCGNLRVEAPETCDDGNLIAGDGCGSTCLIQSGYTCPATGGKCTPICGNGIKQTGETCEDTDAVSGDGCSSTCQTEPGWKCYMTPLGCVYNPTCGDKFVQPNGKDNIPGTADDEQCDDGNSYDTDACKPNCKWSCGDGYKNSKEQCDDGNRINDATCMADCTLPKPAASSSSSSSPAAVCGNGVKQSTEQCDDGNLIATDGCSATCTVNTGYTCNTATPNVCTTTCGDGVRAGAETCDDGNLIGTDGCSSTCTVNTGYTCNTANPNACVTTCGDGLRAGAEQCDDGNLIATDGCSATCTIQTGYACTAGNPSVCSTICGDGRRVGAEACDDGNTVGTDGCSATCTVNPGYSCNTATPNACTPICGNGIRTGAETCDDGNVVNGDGCSSTCTVQAGYSCNTATPNVCTPTVVCGNGIKEGLEECDVLGTNGLPVEKDYCTNTCKIGVDAKEFGATPNDGTDDTSAISTALWAANKLNTTNPVLNKAVTPNVQVRTVYIPAGTYDMTTVEPGEGTTLIGAGSGVTILKRGAMRPYSERMFYIGLYWTSPDKDSELLTIKNMTLDGNALNQMRIGHCDAELANCTEHQDILMVRTADGSKGRYRLQLEGVQFLEAGMQGLGMWRNTDVTVKNSSCHNTYKCMAVTGGNSKLLVDGMRSTGTVGWPGRTFADGSKDNNGPGTSFTIEISTGTQATLVDLKNWQSDLPFIGVIRDTGSILNIENLTQQPRTVELQSHNGAKLRVKNSQFFMSSPIFLKWPGDIEISDTRFTATEKHLATEANRNLTMMKIQWINSILGPSVNQKATCIRCIFDADSTVEATDFVRGIMPGADNLGRNNLLKLDGGSISNAYDVGVYQDKSGFTSSDTRFYIKGMNILAGSGVFVDQYKTSNYNVTLEKVTPHPPKVCRQNYKTSSPWPSYCNPVDTDTDKVTIIP